MSQIINAIFENGVFKPLQKVCVKEREKVGIKILSGDEWQKRFSCLIEKIQEKTKQYDAEEVEADIEQTIREVRAKKNGNKNSGGF